MVFNDFGRVAADVREKLDRVVEEKAREVLITAKVAIQTSPATGEMYGQHQASAPGEPPATDTGNLVNSGRVAAPHFLTRHVVFGSEYAAPLEFGTVKMAARPFLQPSVNDKKDEFVKAVAEVVRKEGR